MGAEVMKTGRILKYLVHVMLVLVVAPVLLLIDCNDYKSKLKAQVKQMMSRDLTIEDDVKLSFAPTPSFVSLVNILGT